MPSPVTCTPPHQLSQYAFICLLSAKELFDGRDCVLFVFYFRGLENVWFIIHTQAKVDGYMASSLYGSPVGMCEYVLVVERGSGPPTLSYFKSEHLKN